MVVLALILGFVLGALVTWVVASRRLSFVESALAGTRAELDVERRSFDDKVVHAVRAASADAYQANSSAFLEIAESKLTGYVKPLKDSLEKVDGQVRDAGAGPRAGVRRAREPVVAAERAHRDPRDGVADAARQGALGRDSAEARRRARGNAAVLRLRRAGHRRDRRRPAAPRPDRPAARREGRDRRRQGAAAGVPGRVRGNRRRRPQAPSRIARSPGA